MSIPLTIPDFGESIQEVQIARWLKKEGDAIEADEDLVELETDKASQTLPSPVSGVLESITEKEGAVVGVGDVIAQLAEGEKKNTGRGRRGEKDRDNRNENENKNENEKRNVKGEPTKKSSSRRKNKTSEAPVSPQDSAVRVMPAAKRMLAEHDLTAEDVKPTGPGGRLLKEDVIRHLNSTSDGPRGNDAHSTRDAPSDGEFRDLEEIAPMSMIRRRIAERLVEAQQNAALLTTFNEIDMSSVIALRNEYREAFLKKYDVKLGFMSFFIKAAIDGLCDFPGLNAEVRGSDIVYRNYFNIGVAIGGGKGLVVPVLRRAERMSFAEIELAIADFARRADQNKIDPQDLQGGTFTISNGGVYGSMLSTPIVNPPQSGVLGMHAIQQRPVARSGEVVIRPMMYVALTYDHRIVDGREAVSFLKRVKDVVEAPARLILEV